MPSVRVAIVAVASVIAVLGRPEHADACSCAPPSATSPADGYVGAPVNAEILVEVYHPDQVVELVGPDGPVDTTVDRVLEQSQQALWRVRPTAPLAPSTTYTIVRDDAPLATFETRSTADDTAPDAFVIDRFEVAYLELVPEWSSSCGDAFARVDLDVGVPGDVASFELTVDHDGTSETTIWLLDELRHLGGPDPCGFGLALQPEEDYCLTLRPRDVAGNTGPATSACATVRRCPLVPDPDQFDEVAAACLSDAPPDPPAPDAGGCAAGGPPGAGALVVLAALLAARRRRSSRPRGA